MALMLMSFEVDNYDEWKELFDSDPAGRKSVAKGHRILRSRLPRSPWNFGDDGPGVMVT
jgi:hypothetical protein